MSGHIKWYSKGKLSIDPSEDFDDDEIVFIKRPDLKPNLEVYTKGGVYFGKISVVKYAYGEPYEITILQPNNVRFICPITTFFYYDFQKKKND